MCVCKGHPGGRKVQVQFVDFGNIKIMSVSDVKKVKNEFLALPAMVRTNPHSTGQSYESCFCVCLSLSTGHSNVLNLDYLSCLFFSGRPLLFVGRDSLRGRADLERQVHPQIHQPGSSETRHYCGYRCSLLLFVLF